MQKRQIYSNCHEITSQFARGGSCRRSPTRKGFLAKSIVNLNAPAVEIASAHVHRHLQPAMLAALFVFFSATMAMADEGEPVALVHLVDGVAVESMGGLRLRIMKSDRSAAVRRDRSWIEDTVPIVAKHAVNQTLCIRPPTQLDHVLDRSANEAAPTWTPVAADTNRPSPERSNSMRIRCQGDVVSVRIDGVHLVFVSNTNLRQADQDMAAGCDALIMSTAPNRSGDALALAKTVHAKQLIVCTDSEVASATNHPGNTLAIVADTRHDNGRAVRVIRLGATPIELSDEVNALIGRKEDACRASQDVFAKLSVKQMNFRPSNGSHTPRWNAEHMMGRELLFFSQIYHAQDPSIPVMDLNPKQMPPDYQARHPDWTGAEEARQMERVTAFTRRFAYLLNDLPLDKKAPESRWTPRGLLRQMERHYNQHTANVKLKFKLPLWPKN